MSDGGGLRGEIWLRDIALFSLGVASLAGYVSWEISVVLAMVYDQAEVRKISRIELRTRG